MSIEKKYQKQLIAIIHKHLPGCKIYLFGSRATNKHHPGSDIDLALDAKKIISFDTLVAILIDIDNTTIPVKVDLVDIHAASNNFLKENIIREGIAWIS
jgi:predicted nucleotidyltransferase